MRDNLLEERLGKRRSPKEENISEPSSNTPKRSLRDSLSDSSSDKKKSRKEKKTPYTINRPKEEDSKKENSRITEKARKAFGKVLKEDENIEPQVVKFQDSVNIDETAISELAMEAAEAKQKRADEKALKRWKVTSRITVGVLVSSCVYLIFLIFGAFMTTYTYQDDGSVVAVKYSVEDIKDKNSFSKVLNYYRMCRDLYEDILLVDYQFSQGVEDYATLGGKYTALLDDAESLYSQISGSDVDTQYLQMTEMMGNWLSNYVKMYLQKIASYCAYSGSDADVGTEAISYYNSTYSYFSQITSNIVSMGSNIKGADMDNIKTWSPDGFISDKTGGVLNS